jgi:hypothetical protein
MSVYVGVNRRIAAMEYSLVPTVLVTQASVEDLQLVESASLFDGDVLAILEPDDDVIPLRPFPEVVDNL